MSPEADYRVDLSVYHGPLDLLLHLIREREMDIHDIPIAEITEQFLAHLEVVKRIDIDRAGDFLLMAATLMLIKSRMLLPRPDEQGDDEGDEELDPRTDLVRQLLEYKRFKDLSRDLDGAALDRSRRFLSGLDTPDPALPDAGRLLAEVGVDDLFLAYERMMRETFAEMDHRVFGETLPMRDVQAGVLALLGGAGGRVTFRALFEERRDRFYIVSVFLALLELLRSRRIALETGDEVVDLEIRLVEPPAAPVNRLP